MVGLHDAVKKDLKAFMDNHIHRAWVLDRFKKPALSHSGWIAFIQQVSHYMFLLLYHSALINFPEFQCHLQIIQKICMSSMLILPIYQNSKTEFKKIILTISNHFIDAYKLKNFK